ncbi:MAG: hypothetical protein NZM04_00760 [Methylacidiphilales bacterium]|nr:hypothetical protein [Candidatus Methylacidiphilales bacterium]MDW8350149.1 hypothetical protein [Verrucomicrobiae bacterium]
MAPFHTKLKNPIPTFLTLSILLLFAPSSQSLWIDELYTGIAAKQKTFSDFYNFLISSPYADIQKPLNLFISWLWSQLFGHSELSLRFPNALWIILSLIPIIRLSQRKSLYWLPYLYALHPFVWYYINESRPYALQIALGAWWLTLFIDWWDDHYRKKAQFYLYISTTLLSLTSLLAFFPIAVGWLIIFSKNIKNRAQRKQTLFSLTYLILALAPSSLIYLYSFATGHQGGARLWPVNFYNYLFAIYEFIGLQGFGPARDELRQYMRSGLFTAVQHSLHYFVPIFCYLLIILRVFCKVITTEIKNHSIFLAFRKYLHLILYLSLPCVTLGIAAYLVSWPFWGRHLAISFPPFIYLTGLFVHKYYQYIKKKFSISIFLFVVALVYSSFELRFDARHQKEDYKNSAILASDYAGDLSKTIWWVASPLAIDYYEIHTYANIHPIYNIQNLDQLKSIIAKTGKPDFIFLSKPDVFDPNQIIQDFINQYNYTLQPAVMKGFKIYSKPYSQH